ncbi:uncharacterized protein VTP21DRAFT_4099 [Calcarisporiella thermophila]|uniref:uncharacterized protein n=1 Tax=Calcarisporiella thermophila TaxID=911321 RepID=UPI0037427A93
MEALTKEFERVQKKQTSVSKLYQDRLDGLIAALESTKERILSGEGSTAVSLANLSKTIKETSAQITDDQKEFHSALSKYGKAIDKKFKQELAVGNNPEAFRGKEDILNRTVAMHLIRQGQFELANSFIQEAHLDIPNELQEQFMEMYHILAALKAKNLEPALNWAKSKHEQLQALGSTLEFDLHKLRFIQLVTTVGCEEALAYSKISFGQFAETHMHEIQRLMCSLLFLSRLDRSPYADLLSPSYWSDIQHAFTTDFCRLLGLPAESPLYITVTVGTTALPTIIKMFTIMRETKNEWSQADELPVEIPLAEDLRFHSIFACPVSKEQGTEENPPMMLTCGHVICRESLGRLSRGNSVRFKCPYCPSESTPNQAMRVYF